MTRSGSWPRVWHIAVSWLSKSFIWARKHKTKAVNTAMPVCTLLWSMDQKLLFNYCAISICYYELLGSISVYLVVLDLNFTPCLPLIIARDAADHFAIISGRWVHLVYVCMYVCIYTYLDVYVKVHMSRREYVSEDGGCYITNQLPVRTSCLESGGSAFLKTGGIARRPGLRQLQ